MKKIAIIPLRAGSKGIPGKNKKKLLGRPLYQWTLGEAIYSQLDEIFVFTDDKEIIDQVEKEYKWTPKVKALQRSTESASDTASTEFALKECADRLDYNFDLICLLQATSPLTTRMDINAAIDKITKEEFDSALSVVETKRFIWSEDGKSVNYDYLHRPRRQDFDGLLIENGAVYTSTKDQFLNTGNRIGGKIGIIKMPEDTLTEIDEIADWHIIEKLLENRLNKQKRGHGKIKAMVFDVDGVFTDGTVAVSGEGELFKRFSLRDGMGLELLRNEGIIPIVMTSEDSPIVAKRMEKLKIKHAYLGVKDKFTRIESVLNQIGIKRNEVAYLGDDINDMANISSMGWGMCPNDAILSIQNISDLKLSFPGGDKAIRDAIEFIIKYNKKFDL